VIDEQYMNEDDWAIMKNWASTGYVKWGRLSSDSIQAMVQKIGRHWVELSDEAWVDVAKLRRIRAKRMFDKREWKKTSEVD
jgi:hypothetical protein